MQPTASNPTAVNSFNGRSDDTVAANHFEKLYESGAFDSTDPKVAAEQQAERAQATDSAPPAAKSLPLEASQEDSGAAAASEPEYVNFDDYLQKAGLERESFLKLPVRVKDADIPLADLLKRAEVEQDYTAQSAALAEKQKAFEAQQAQLSTQWQDRLKQAETLGGLAYQELVREYNAIDWNSLSQTDPARWAVLQTQFQQRNSSIQNHLAQVQAQQAEIAKQAQAKQADVLKSEMQAMLKVVPEWRDEAKFKSARDQMFAYAKTVGISEQQLNALGFQPGDHLLMRALHDAAQWHALQSSKAESLKKVRAAPVASNPGARIARDPNVTQLAQAKDQFMKTRGRNQDTNVQANYFEQLARSQ